MSPTIRRLCRLCLRDEQLVNVFDKRLDNGYQLRLCIFLCSGVEIRMTDKIPKVICHSCCSLAVELYKFRQITLANDKTLKDFARQSYEAIPADKDGLQHLHDSILRRISKAKLSDPAAEFLEKESDRSPNDKFQYFPEIAGRTGEGSDGDSDSDVSDDEDEDAADSDDDDTTIATLKRKYRAAKSGKKKKERSGSRLYFLSESDSDSEPIFKRMKRNKYYIDDDYSGCESGTESRYGRSKRKSESEETRKERLRPQRGKPQTPEAESLSEKSIEKQVAEQKCVSEPYSKYCEYCDRYFWGNSQLKAHQKVHFRCQFCIKGFESQEVLQEHLINVCYKTITRNKPFVSLVRVDQNVQFLEKYKTTFGEYFEDIADGIYGNPELIKNPSVKFHLYHTETHRLAEKKTIEEFFVRFEHLDNTPVHKNAFVQTKRPQTDLAYTNSSQIILDDARKDLKLFDIPIYLVIDRIQSAYISFVKPPQEQKVTDMWSAKDVKDVSDKSKIVSFYQDETVPEQKKLPANKNATHPTPKVPTCAGPRKPFSNLPKKVGFEPRIKQFAPRNTPGNVRMNNTHAKIVGIARPDQNTIRKPLKPPPNVPNAAKPTGKVLYRSPNPNMNTVSKKNTPDNVDTLKQYKNIPPNKKNTQNSADGPKEIIPNNTEGITKSINDTSAPYSKMLQTISNKLNLQRTISPKTTTTAFNATSGESNLNVTVNNIIKHVSGSVTIQISKQNPKQQTLGNEPPQSGVLNISNSVTLEKNHPKQTNHTVQNNINYPPRPNTAIRNMLESISSEISIEPNYQRQIQSSANNVNNRSNNPSTTNDSVNTNSIISNTNSMNSTTFVTPTSTAYKPNRITYPRPILIKEEFPPEDNGYNNQSMPEQPLLYNMDYPVKEEHQSETQNYIKTEITEDTTSYSSNIYQNTPQQVNYNSGYSQEPPLRYNHNQQPQQQQQYFRPLTRTNLPAVRHRFAVAQPYRNVEYRPTNHHNMYQTRLNTPTMPSNALVPTNSYNTNNFIPNNVYNRPYGDNYNNYNNMYQPPYQNQYPPAYNTQQQPTVDYNNTYAEPAPTQEVDSKFLRIKQPWELYR